MLTVLTGLTLAVLVIYTFFTYQISKSSVEQVENVQMPFIAVAMREGTAHEPGGWMLANQGFGSAVNIRYSVYDARGVKTLREIMPLARSDHYSAAHNDISAAFGGQWPFEIDYESLSGKKYRTVVTSVGGRRTTFQRL